MQSSLNPKALLFGIIGATIPLLIIIIGVRVGKANFQLLKR